MSTDRRLQSLRPQEREQLAHSPMGIISSLRSCLSGRHIRLWHHFHRSLDRPQTTSRTWPILRMAAETALAAPHKQRIAASPAHRNGRHILKCHEVRVPDRYHIQVHHSGMIAGQSVNPSCDLPRSTGSIHIRTSRHSRLRTRKSSGE